MAQIIPNKHLGKEGFSLVAAVIGIAIFSAAFILLSKIVVSHKSHEVKQNLKLSQQQILTLVGNELQSISYDMLVCQCCLSLNTAPPASINITRATPPSCPAVCQKETPLFGFRNASGARTSKPSPSDLYVGIEACHAEANDQVTAVTLFAQKDSPQSTLSKLKFIKGRW